MSKETIFDQKIMFATVPVTAAVDGYPCRGKGAVTLERFTPLRRYEKPLVQKTRVAIFAHLCKMCNLKLC